jgi:hypothetical protein
MYTVFGAYVFYRISRAGPTWVFWEEQISFILVERRFALESPLLRQPVDICPTGVYTDKTARFAPVTGTTMAPSVARIVLWVAHTPAARYREPEDHGTEK